MNIKEMHIRFNNQYQRQASNQLISFDEDQVDILLNIGQDRKVNQLWTFATKQGKRLFEEGQKRLDALRAIIVKNYRVDAIEPTESSYLYEDNMNYGILPQGYRHLLSDRSKIKYINDKNCKLITTGNSSTIKEYIAVVPYVIIAETLCDPSFEFKLKLMDYLASDGTRSDDTIITVTAGETGQIDTPTENSDKFELINYVLEVLNRNNNAYENADWFSSDIETNNRSVEYNVYWERYRDQYYQDHFIISTKLLDLSYARDSVHVSNVYVGSTGNTVVTSAQATNITVEGYGFKNGQKVFFNNGTDDSAAITLVTPTASITGTADNSGFAQFTSNTHGLSVGDIVELTGTTSYNKVHIITAADTNTFTTDQAYDTADSSGTWTQVVNSITAAYPNADSNFTTTTTPLQLDVYVTENANTDTSTYISKVQGLYVGTTSSAANMLNRELSILNNDYNGIYVVIDGKNTTDTTTAELETYFETASNSIKTWNETDDSKLGKFYEVTNYKSQLDVSYTSSTVITTQERANRLHEPEDIYRIRNHPFADTEKNSPLSTLAGNHLFVYNDGKFIVDEIILDYIKQPRRLSLKNSQSCELIGETIHQEIVDMAVQAALSSTSNPRLASQIEEQLLNH